MMSCARNEWRYFLLALGFFTRIPVPSLIDFRQDDLNQSAKYFPFVGMLVGAIGAGAYIVSAQFLPSNIAILISMLATIYVTGAFHEDGLADSVDGLGGGWSREQILAIMQDSRLGTYGAIALCLILFSKFQILNALPIYFVPFILVISHTLSRLCALYVMASLTYVKLDGKAKPLATKLKMSDLAIATLFGVLPVLLIYWHFLPTQLSMNDWLGLVVCCLVPVVLVWVWWRNKIKHWLGGYTGDCLGAMQQMTELALYFGLLIWCQQL